MGKISDRNYKLVPKTLDMMSALPTWMRMATDVNSVGFRFFNALVGTEIDRIERSFEWVEMNVSPSKAYINEVDSITVGEFPYLDPDTESLSAVDRQGVDIKSIDVHIVNDREFFYGPPTRVSVDSNIVSPSSIYGNIIGLEYVKEMDSYPSSSGAYIVTHDIPNNVDISGVSFFDTDWNLIGRKSYGVNTQNYDNVGYYEIMRQSSGYLEHTPISGTVRMYDYLHLTSGVATEVFQSGNAYPNEGLTWSTDGSYYEFHDASGIRQTGYYAEYMWLDYLQNTYVTTSEKSDHISVWDGTPMFSVQATGYTGTEIPISWGIDGAAIRVDPIYLRPGNVATVSRNYSTYATGVWVDSSGTDFEMTLSDPYFVETYPSAVHVYDSSGNDLWPRSEYPYNPSVSGNYVTIPAIDLATGVLDVTIIYDALYSEDITGVQSYSNDGNHQYPYEYEIIKHKDKDYVKPYTMLPVTGVLASGIIGGYTVTTNKEYVGLDCSGEDEVLSRNIQRSATYVLERNNHVLHRRNTIDGTSINSWALFCPNPGVSGYVGNVIPSGISYLKEEDVEIEGKLHKRYYYIDSDGMPITTLDTRYFPLLTYDMHTDVTVNGNGDLEDFDNLYRDVRGMVFYDGKLYIAASQTKEDDFVWPKTQGTFEQASTSDDDSHGHIYVLDTSDLLEGTQAVPVELTDDAFSLGTSIRNPLDITLDEDENLLVVDGNDNTIKKAVFRYDYATTDPDQVTGKTTVYYREDYDDVFDI